MSAPIRIISGKAKGRRITTPGGATHPMGDRERLALFNSLTDRIRGSRVLDLYAGSGALGLEAISRGAKLAVFVEQDLDAAHCILKNIRDLKFEAKATLISGDDAKTVLRSSELHYSTFDIILCDPPYEAFISSTLDPEDPDSPVPEVIAEHLNKNGIFILSHPTDQAPEISGLDLKSTRKYARAHLSFYEKTPE